MHAVLIVLAFALSRSGTGPDQPRRVEITFFRHEPPPPEPAVVHEPPPPTPPTTTPPPEPTPQRETERPPVPPRPTPAEERAAPPKPEPRPSPPPRFDPRTIARALPEPEPEPRRSAPPRETQVRTNLFGAAKAPAPPRAASPRAKTRVAGFGSVATAGVEPAAPAHRRVVSRSEFGDVRNVRADPAERARERVVTRPGFEATVVDAPPTEREPRIVVEGHFADSATDRTEPSHEAARDRSVATGGFGRDANEAPARPARRLPDPDLDAPVRVVSKPTPAYTDQARRLRIEGEVVLEVTFVASGRLRVLRVVEGLGHGLDEAAVTAAEKIEFTPARRDGKPVDHTATLRVVFRLA